MTDIQAALGLTQIKRIDPYVSKRNELANRYRSLLIGLPLKVPERNEFGKSAWHLYVIQLDDSLLASRGQIFDDMRADGIGVNVHYIPVHMQPYFRKFGFREGAFPQAEKYYRKAISIPLHPGLTNEQQDSVVASLKNAILNVAVS
jgi:dTDP-4-amino-4,6-dideoxygalactose transaminase